MTPRWIIPPFARDQTFIIRATDQRRQLLPLWLLGLPYQLCSYKRSLHSLPPFQRFFEAVDDRINDISQPDTFPNSRALDWARFFGVLRFLPRLHRKQNTKDLHFSNCRVTNDPVRDIYIPCSHSALHAHVEASKAKSQSLNAFYLRGVSSPGSVTITSFELLGAGLGAVLGFEVLHHDSISNKKKR